jgi:hypothetical protein
MIKKKSSPFSHGITVIAATTLVSISGCQNLVPRPKGAISHLPEGSQGVTLEVAKTVDDQARELVANTQTYFQMNLDDAPAAWDRAKLFLEKYLSADGSRAGVVTKIVGARWGLSNGSSSTGSYVYEVWREDVQDGYKFKVSCKPKQGASAQLAELNARNLARFIQDGRLELSLLAR